MQHVTFPYVRIKTINSFELGGGQMSEPSDPKSRADVTQFLIGYGKGDRSALDEMLPLVYSELKRLASYYLNREREGHTLQTTALVHEAYLRLIDQKQVNWKNRSQFLGLAAEMMRRILVNHARDRAAGKRGGGAKRVSLSVADGSANQPDVDLIALDQALTELSELDNRKARIVELKFFGGMTTEETAELLEISTATVEREWVHARAWLFRAIKGSAEATNKDQ
jgi:RNA polymerase sigma factor (TIGR02999 family)